jgi:8-oxo-dGTP pyrophosphatase MutT (NUDIX family)
MKQIDKLAWIELTGKTILLTKSYGKDVFYIPGGKRDIGETDEQALLR